MVCDVFLEEIGHKHSQSTEDDTEAGLEAFRQIEDECSQNHRETQGDRTQSKGSASEYDREYLIGNEDALELHCDGNSGYEGEQDLVELEAILEYVDERADSNYCSWDVEYALRPNNAEKDAANDKSR